MPVKLIDVTGSNETILNGIRNNASLAYQSRVDYATQANLKDVAEKLWNNPPARNEFVDALLNQIGLIVARTLSWSNPLAVFKIGVMPNGDTIEEYAIGLTEANVYDPNREYLERDVFGQVKPEVKAAFHKINRQVFYKITVNEVMLQRAFTTDGGLAAFVNDMMLSPMNSDQIDEYKTIAELLALNYELGGYFKVHVEDLNATGATAEQSEAAAKYLLKQTRAFADRLAFVSTAYNAWGMPVHATRDKLVLITTPEANASMDVDALAGLFNIERGQVPFRVIVLPAEDIGIPGVQAILTTDDFFVIADTAFETRSIQNPASLSTNYFVHHHGIISMSPFAPAILFWTGEGDTLPNTVYDVTSIGAFNVTDDQGVAVVGDKVIRGDLYNVDVKAITNPVGGPNDAVKIAVSGTVPLSPFTRLYQSGTLIVGLDEDNTSLTITGTSVDKDTVSATKVLTVAGDKLQQWPDPEVLEDDDTDALLEVTPKAVPAAPTTGANKNKVTIPTPDEGYDYKDGATTVNGQTLTLTANKTITAVAKAGYELKTGATASWNLVFTA